MLWRPMGAADLELAGVSIIPSALAMHRHTEFVLARVSPHKRRKAWRVERVVTERPAAYMMGSTLVMHPSLVERLKAQSQDGKGGA